MKSANQTENRLSNLNLSHKEFIDAYKNNEVGVTMDPSDAVQLCQKGVLGKGRHFNRITWSWLWMLGLVAGPILGFIYSWWFLILAFLSLLIPKALRKTHIQNTIQKMLNDKVFYQKIIKDPNFSVKLIRKDERYKYK